jgi:hypothetical protein
VLANSAADSGNKLAGCAVTRLSLSSRRAVTNTRTGSLLIATPRHATPLTSTACATLLTLTSVVGSRRS